MRGASSRWGRVVTAALGAGVLIGAMGCGETRGSRRGEPFDLRPLAVEVEGWSLAGEPQLFVGDQLFELVNGGAELYHRYGFVQVLSAQYTAVGGRSIALELFEMRDAEGARGIYSAKVGSDGEHPEIGDEAVLEGYYLNVRSGRFLVTLTGYDSDPETVDGLVRVARAVESRLGGAR